MKVTIFVWLFILTGLIHAQNNAPEVVVQSGHSSDVLDAKISRDGKYLISAGADSRVIIWDRKLQKQFRELDHHKQAVTSILLHPSDEKLFYSASSDGTVWVNNMVTGASDLVIDVESPVSEILYLPISKRFIIGTEGILEYDKDFKLINAHNVLGSYGAMDGVMWGTESIVRDLDVSTDEKKCVVTNASGKSVVFYFEEDDRMYQMQKKSIEKLAFQEKGKKVFQCYTDGQLKLSVPKTIHSKAILSLDFSTKSALCRVENRFYVGTGNGHLQLINPSLPWVVKTKKISDYKVTSIQYDPNNDLLVIADMEGKIYVFDRTDLHLQEVYESKVKVISDYQVDEFMKKVVVSFKDNTLEVFDLTSLQSLINEELKPKKFSKRFTKEVVKVEWKGGNVLITYLDKKSSLEVRDRYDYVKEYQVLWDLNENKLMNKTIAANPKFASNYDRGFCSYLLPNQSFEGSINFPSYRAKLYLFDDHQFVIFNDKNQYFSSKDGIKNIGFRLDNELYSFEQFDLIYNRPDKIFEPFVDVLGEELIESYQLAYQKRISRLGFDPDKAEIRSADIPNVEISEDETAAGNSVRLSWDAKNAFHPKLHLYVNGVPEYGSDGLSVSRTNQDTALVLNLEQGKNNLACFVTSGSGLKSFRKELVINISESEKSRDLYLVTIGCSKYQEAEYNLDYASKDAQDVAKFLSKNKNYKNTHVLTITDEQVTKGALYKMRDFISTSKIQDVVMFYIAGHGVLSKDYDLYLASHDMDFNAPTNNGISYRSIEEILEGCDSRHKCLFLDACHSGEIDKEEVELAQSDVSTEDGDVKFRNFNQGVNILDQNSFQLSKTLFADMQPNHGITIVSSAGGAEFALEGSKWKNGVFTYSFLNGISNGDADLNKDGKIMLSEITKYVLSNVVKLTNGKQNPTSRIENIYNDIQIF